MGTLRNTFIDIESVVIDVWYHISRFFTSRNDYIFMSRTCRYFNNIFKDLLRKVLIPQFPPIDDSAKMWIDIYAKDLRDGTYVIEHPGRYQLREILMSSHTNKPLLIIRNTHDVRLNLNNYPFLPNFQCITATYNPLIVMHDCQRVVVEKTLVINHTAPIVECHNMYDLKINTARCFLLEGIPCVENLPV
jgi:hypothetical protein